MLSYFIVFGLIGFFISKVVKVDKAAVTLIVATAIFWGLVHHAVWGVATLGELLLGYSVGRIVSKTWSLPERLKILHLFLFGRGNKWLAPILPNPTSDNGAHDTPQSLNATENKKMKILSSREQVDKAIQILQQLNLNLIYGIDPITGQEYQGERFDDLSWTLYWAEKALNAFVPPPDEKGITFGRMGGFGEVKCKLCGYREKIVSFTHGLTSCTSGYQCQNCWKFESVDDTNSDEIEKGCSCGGTLSRRMKLYCPRCRSIELAYSCIAMT